jgi:hypothetical protein
MSFCFTGKIMTRRFVLLLSLIVLLNVDAFSQCVGDVFAAPRRQRVGELLNKNAAADFDGDGNADAAIADHYSNRIFVMKGDGEGNFGTPTAYETGLNPLDLEKGDFDGDGFVDLISAIPATARFPSFSARLTVSSRRR